MEDQIPDDHMRAQRREQVLVEAFVLLSDSLVDDYDVVDLLDKLVTTAVDLLHVDEAGLLFDDQRGGLRVMASSSEEARLLEVFQLQSQQGPCLDCISTSQVVASPDLLADEDRWPLFVPVARSTGFRSVHAVPLRIRDVTIGALNLFSAAPRSLGAGDARIAQALADVATIGIVQQRSVHRSTVLAEQLQTALNCRVVIEQAKGVLAERDGLTMDDAFSLLRRHARSHNVKLSTLAEKVVKGEIILDQPA